MRKNYDSPPSDKFTQLYVFGLHTHIISDGKKIGAVLIGWHLFIFIEQVFVTGHTRRLACAVRPCSPLFDKDIK